MRLYENEPSRSILRVIQNDVVACRCLFADPCSASDPWFTVLRSALFLLRTYYSVIPVASAMHGHCAISASRHENLEVLTCDIA